jgi:hypothetical protein
MNLILSAYNSASVTDLEILMVLVTRLLRRDLNRLVNEMEPVELWDEGQLSHVISYKGNSVCIGTGNIKNVTY